MARLGSMLFLLACVALAISYDEEIDDLKRLGNYETRDILKAGENLESFNNLETYDNLELVDNLGVLGKRILQEQLKNVAESVDAILEELNGEHIDGFSGKQGDTTYNISNIKITDFEIDLNPTVKFMDDFSSAEMTFNLSRLTIDAGWWVTYKNWFIRSSRINAKTGWPSWVKRKRPLTVTRDGSLTATADRVPVTVIVSLNPLEVEECRASADISVDVKGHFLPLKILLLFKKLFVIVNDQPDLPTRIKIPAWGRSVNDLERKLEGAICDAIYKL